MFEGLYARALEPTGAFKDALKAKGFDLDRPQPEYPVAVWHDCLDVTAEHLYPLEPRDKAWELIGRRFIEGYFKTLVGRMISTTLSFMTPKMFIPRGPRFVTTGLKGADVSVAWEGEKKARLILRGVHEYSSSLMMGVMGVCFERMHATGVTMRREPLGPVDTAVVIELP
jgi:uncharacterized protein (TIGR02265 family)